MEMAANLRVLAGIRSKPKTTSATPESATNVSCAGMYGGIMDA